MIFTAFFAGFFGILTFLFAQVDVPAMPQAVIDGLSWFTTNLASVVNVARYVLTPEFYLALLVIFVGVLTFDYVWGFIFWVLRKIPFLDIH